MTPTDTMQRYFETWNARDFDAFEAQLAPDRIRRVRVTFDPRPLLS